MNRAARRAQKAKGADRVLTVNCNTCRGVICQIPMGRSLAARAATVERAFRRHCAISGCVKAQDIEPVDVPE